MNWNKIFDDSMFYKHFLSRGDKCLNVTTSDITHINTCGVDDDNVYLNIFTKDYIYQKKIRLKFLETVYMNYKQEIRHDKINTILNG